VSFKVALILFNLWDYVKNLKKIFLIQHIAIWNQKMALVLFYFPLKFMALYFVRRAR